MKIITNKSKKYLVMFTNILFFFKVKLLIIKIVINRNKF